MNSCRRSAARRPLPPLCELRGDVLERNDILRRARRELIGFLGHVRDHDPEASVDSSTAIAPGPATPTRVSTRGEPTDESLERALPPERRRLGAGQRPDEAEPRVEWGVALQADRVGEDRGSIHCERVEMVHRIE
jgi:hypothetical protein